jgi:AraC-like DNA-binding protein
MQHTADREWSRYYRIGEVDSVEALHARFVTHRYSRHAHDYFVVGVVETGAQSYSYRGSRHVTPAGQIFLVNPDESHTGEAATIEGYLYRSLYFRRSFLARASEDIGTRAQILFLKGAVLHDPHLASLLLRFHKCLAERVSRLEQESVLLETLACLVTQHADSQVTSRGIGKERPAVKRAREYIETHFDEDLSLSKLASLVSLSPYYFARAFQNETGLPPHAYLEGIRIRKAREYLDQGSTIVSAALSVGYSDQSHLSRRFKSFLGITPGQYAGESKIWRDKARLSKKRPIWRSISKHQ